MSGGPSDAAPPAVTTTRHSPALDALRGLAALAVFYLHLAALTDCLQGVEALQRLAPLGMFGVDLFYVLSGYFICGAILRPANWSPAAFVVQRIRRIVPAYYVSVMLVVLGGGLMLHGWGAVLQRDALLDVLRHLAFIHNLWPASHGSINGVYWTLGVEAGFYAVMLVCARWLRNPGRAAWVLALWCAVALVWRAGVFFLAPEDAWTRFFLATQLPGALDTFAVGAALALVHTHRPAWRDVFGGPFWSLTLLCLVVVLGVSLAYVLPLKEAYWSGFFPAVLWRIPLALALGGFVFWFSSVSPGSMLDRLLRMSGLSLVGKMSFSLYLYHVPVIFTCLWLQQRGWLNVSSTGLLLVILSAVSLVSMASYLMVEAPALARRGAAPEPLMSARWRPALLCIMLILALATALRFNGIARESFWSDELFSVGVATHVGRNDSPPPTHKHLVDLEMGDHFLTWKQADTAPPLYEILLKLWGGLFGDTELALRSLSALFGVLTVCSALWLRRALPPTQVCLYAGLLAICGVLIEYSQEARAYSLAIFLASLSLALLLRDLVRPRGVGAPLRMSLAQGFVMALLMLTHYYGLPYCGLMALTYAWHHLRERRWGRLAMLGLPFLPVLAYLPWGLNGIRIKLDSPLLQQVGLGASILRAFRDTARLVTPNFGSWIWLLLITVAGLGLHQLWLRRRGGVPAEGASLAALGWTAFILVPFLIVLGVATRKVEFYNPRYLLLALPALLLLLTLALGRLTGAWRALSGAALGACVVLSLGAWVSRPAVSKEQYREAAAFVTQQFQPGDLVVGMWRPNRVLYAHYLGAALGQDFDRYLEAVSSAAQIEALLSRVAPGHKVFLLDHVDLRAMTDETRTRMISHGFRDVDHRLFFKTSAWVLQR